MFRVARTADTAAGHALEARLLPELDLDVPLPLPEWRVLPGDNDLQFGALGHRKLPGERLSPLTAEDSVATEVGSFTAALHSFPLEEAKRLRIPRQAPWSARVRGLEDLVPMVGNILAPDERRQLTSWWRRVRHDVAMSGDKTVLTHRDLWYGNVLVGGSPARLAGVLDWEAAAVGDPAEDLAPQFYLGDDFALRVMDAYGADDQLRYRVGRFRELREFAGIRWALQERDEDELIESIEKLRRTSIFST